MDEELKLLAKAGAGLLIFLVLLVGACIKGNQQRDEYCLQLAKNGVSIHTVPRCMER